MLNAEERGFVTIQVPAASPFSDQQLAPKKQPNRRLTRRLQTSRFRTRCWLISPGTNGRADPRTPHKISQPA
jgi:hypothetical protein